MQLQPQTIEQSVFSTLFSHKFSPKAVGNIECFKRYYRDNILTEVRGLTPMMCQNFAFETKEMKTLLYSVS